MQWTNFNQVSITGSFQLEDDEDDIPNMAIVFQTQSGHQKNLDCGTSFCNIPHKISHPTHSWQGWWLRAKSYHLGTVMVLYPYARQWDVDQHSSDPPRKDTL